MKPKVLRSRGWATTIVGVLFLVFGMLASLSNFQTLDGSVATVADFWRMTFWILVGITGATLVIAGVLIVAMGYLSENQKP